MNRIGRRSFIGRLGGGLGAGAIGMYSLLSSARPAAAYNCCNTCAVCKCDIVIDYACPYTDCCQGQTSVWCCCQYYDRDTGQYCYSQNFSCGCA